MIGIICAGQIELSPFVKKYIKVFEENNIEYEIIHWDRSGEERCDPSNYHTFTLPLERYSSKFKKAVPFIKFCRFVSKCVKRRKYDKLVILTTQTAIFSLGLLLGKYRKKYFFDYRDTSYEYLKPYSMLINKICNNSVGMCVSSPGFLEYIKTTAPVSVSHNFQDAYYERRKMECVGGNGEKIVVGYIGVLREFEYLKKLILQFSADNRFEFVIHGSGDCIEQLREFSKDYDNIKVMGAYKEEDKQAIVDSFDMICYNYPTSFVNYPAVANKLYDGLIMKKPLFANSRTFSGKLIKENGLGISVDENSDKVTEELYDYYTSFNREEFAQNCEKYLEKVMNDEKDYIAAIKNIIQG